MAKVVRAGSSSLYPTPAVVVTCALPERPPNGLAIAWTGILCSQPPLVGVSIRPERYSHYIISQTGEFVINMPRADQAALVDRFGMVSGRDVDKFALIGVTAAPAREVKAPLIEEFPVNLECRVQQRVMFGTHELFVAEVVAVQIDEQCLEHGGGFDTDAASPLVFVPLNGEYRALAEVQGSYGFTRESEQPG